MLVAATADIHAPLNLRTFRNSILELEKEPEVFILAGDIIDNGNYIYLKKVYEIIKERFSNIKIISVFGNNEYIQHRDIIKKDYGFMNWLDDDFIEFKKIYIVGTEGILDSLTPWQKKHFPELKNIWDNRIKKLGAVLEKLRDKKIIFVSHYAPVCETTFGDPAPKPWLCSVKMKKMLEKFNNIELILHGHSHAAKIYKSKLRNIDVYNVSFYIHKKPLLFEV